jgi:hypothetical protein
MQGEHDLAPFRPLGRRYSREKSQLVGRLVIYIVHFSVNLALHSFGKVDSLTVQDRVFKKSCPWPNGSYIEVV